MEITETVRIQDPQGLQICGMADTKFGLVDFTLETFGDIVKPRVTFNSIKDLSLKAVDCKEIEAEIKRHYEAEQRRQVLGA